MQITRTIAVQTDDGRTLPLSAADLYALRTWLVYADAGQRKMVTAIKYVRLVFPGLGLKEGKDIVELLCSDLEWAR
jgi:ribosomal protein L7/L12